MIVKTRAALSERVATAVKEMHSYSVPAIIVVPLESVDQPYLEWLMAETEAAVQQGEFSALILRSAEGASRKDGAATDLGFTRDRHVIVRKSGKPDLRGGLWFETHTACAPHHEAERSRAFVLTSSPGSPSRSSGR